MGNYTHSLACWLTLGSLAAAGPLAAAAPVIDSLTVQPSWAAPGGTVTLTVTAHDPDCANPLGCTSECGAAIAATATRWTPTTTGTWVPSNGTTGSPYSASATWTAPATEGTYALGVSVSDNGAFACTPRLTTTATLFLQVTAVANAPPAISALTAMPAVQLADRSVALTCATIDPDGDSVAYAWAADQGTLTPGPDNTATFTAATPLLATITCTATDSRGGKAFRQTAVSISDAVATGGLSSGLAAPARLGADRWGNLYVADRAAGGIVVLHLDGTLAYVLPLADIRAVAVDWNDDLLVASDHGVELRRRDGRLIRELVGEPELGEVADVAVDPVNQRYGVLHRWSARVELFAASGSPCAAFGTLGDGTGQLRAPSGLAFQANGNVVVADSGHGLVHIFDPSGSLQLSFGGQGNGVGKFVALDDVEVLANGVIVTSDTFSSRIQTFDASGAAREAFGGFGSGIGLLRTPAGLAALPAFDRIAAASVNSSSVQLFRTSDAPPTAPLPMAQVEPAALVFADHAVSSSSPSQTVRLTNPGRSPLGLRGLVTSGEFAVDSACGPMLDPGGVCDLGVSFTPAGTGPRDGSLTLDVSTGSPLVVALTGNGFVAPSLVGSATSFVFARQRVEHASAPQTLRVVNAGSLPLDLASPAVSGDFAITHDCGAFLAGGASCNLAVSFTPHAVSPSLTGNLSLAHAAAGSPYAVALSGSSYGTALAASPVQLDFPELRIGETSAPQTVTFRNQGEGSVVLGQLALGGAPASSFGLRDDLCSGRTLATGESCTTAVVFAPRTSGALAATLASPSDADQPADDVALHGVAAAQSVLEIPTLSALGLFAFAAALALAGRRRLSRAGRSS